jgi:putative ABC transport system ATP-binding protein
MPPLEPLPHERSRSLLHPVVLRGISKTYRLDAVDVPALVEIELVILPDRFTVISGPSGSGKTTLLNLIGCIDRPDRGTIMIAGKAVHKLSDDQLSDFRARQLGFVFQNFNLLPVLTAFENVEYPLVLAGMAAAKRRDRAQMLLDSVGLAAHAKSCRVNSRAASANVSRSRARWRASRNSCWPMSRRPTSTAGPARRSSN